MNKFREKIEEQIEEEKELEQRIRIKQVEEREEEKSESSKFSRFLDDGKISKETAARMLPFVMFLGVIGMLYIANSHFAVRNIRKIDQLNKEVKELTWEYKSLKADLMFKSKMTEVAKKVDTIGLKELVEPPIKIVVESKK